MRLIDSHCHLDYNRNRKDIDEVISRAKSNNLVAIITCTIDKKIDQVKLLIKKYNNYVFHSLGLHPPGYTKESVKYIKKLILENSNSIVSIGEVGLDYHWVKNEKDRKYQEIAFREFIKLSKKINKPIVVHSREAEKEAIDILEDENASNVLMHCYSGPVELVKRIINNNWLISVPTSVVNRKIHQKIAIECPLKNMVIETDSPFLSPDKEKNEPYKVIFAAKKISELKKIGLNKVADETTANAIKFYSLPL
ncbi:MAG: TatD family hydrolase [Candidatus Helarchaeota archaeon]